MTATALPGYRVVTTVQPLREEGLRNDVTAFLGSTVRGPLGVPVRVAGRQAYAAAYGGAERGTVPRAFAAFVANGGEVAWVVRAGLGGAPAAADVVLAGSAVPARVDLPGSTLRLTATSPGEWGNGMRVRITYRAYGFAGDAELDLVVEAGGTGAFRRAGLAADELVDAIAATGLVTASFDGPPLARAPGAGNPGPSQLVWAAVLSGGEEPVLDRAALLAGLDAQAEVEEVALVCVPRLADLPELDQDDVVAALATSCAASQDRLAVVSAPVADAPGFGVWRQRLRAAVPDPAAQRAVAAYLPWVRAAAPAPTGPDRYPATDPVGHLCGVIARLDRERGSGWSPANTLMTDAVDLVTPLPDAFQQRAVADGVNLVRERTGGGLEVWGARTLDPGDGRYVAHRRLVHRLVRAIRRVTEPLVFDTNDELLWFSVVRAVSGVLMEAFRSGALRGETPDQAYRVRCDETTNPPDAVDEGRVVCEIQVAPATPMEFITLRLTLGAEGLLEVVEQ
jgi:phage tail sheath protein FI